jgi:uncharacterized protein YjbI with pentapeptide repeats
MAVFLSPVGGAAVQFFDNSGNVLTGGKLYTYLAGTTTNQATYTSNTGITFHTNPIILDASGRVPGGEIWLADGVQYKFVLKDANEVLIGTYDNLIGINSNFLNYEVQQEFQTATAGQTVFNLTTITYTPGTNTLSVFVDGVNQYGPGAQYAYIETDSDTVTFVSGLHVGALVKFTTAVTLSAGVTTAALVTYNEGDIGAVDQTVEARLQQYVSVEDFGAIGNGIADDTAAIQAALDTGKAIYAPVGTYLISSTLRLAADGQIFYGAGTGNVNEPARTIIKWGGSAGGTMLSISNGTTENWQNCTIQDMFLNGNSLALTAVQGYDSTIAGGAWRNRYVNLTISGLTGANNTAFDFGSGAFPNFAHDVEITGCFVIGAVRGVYGAGALHRFINTTFSSCTSGVSALAGSAWSFDNCVFSNSTQYDFTGSNIQIANFSGCWFEDSGVGIYQAATAHSCNFSGCYLQTNAANVTKLMDMGNAAGNFSIKGSYVPVSSGSTLVTNINGNFDYDVLASNVTIDSGYRSRTYDFVRADNGVFAAGITNDQNNVTGDGTVVSLNTVAYTEEYDTSNLFNAATGVFTAGLFGYYQFSGQIALGEVAAGHTSAYLTLVTSNDTYLLGAINPGAVRTNDNYVFLQGTVVVELQPTDTAYLEVVVSGSTKTVDILSGTTLVNWRTRFEGRMI